MYSNSLQRSSAKYQKEFLNISTLNTDKTKSFSALMHLKSPLCLLCICNTVLV